MQRWDLNKAWRNENRANFIDKWKCQFYWQREGMIEDDGYLETTLKMINEWLKVQVKTLTYATDIYCYSVQIMSTWS